VLNVKIGKQLARRSIESAHPVSSRSPKTGNQGVSSPSP